MFLFMNISCDKTDFNVPEASTQAQFSWTQEVVEQNGESVFKITFTNESVNATSYAWEFGNGETSTEENPVVIFTEEGDFTVTLTVTSAKELYYNTLITSHNLRLLLKEVVFEENFDVDGSIDNFTLIDNDGDGENWYWDSYDGDGYILSASWLDPNPLTPDNFIITSAIDLTNVESGREVILNYSVCPTASTPDYRTEHYSVFISTTGTEATDFTDQIFQETLTTDMENWVYVLREIDLSSYAGQTIYIAFRHHESTDKDRISLNDIEVFAKL